jgi:hypothetical protein
LCANWRQSDSFWLLYPRRLGPHTPSSLREIPHRGHHGDEVQHDHHPDRIPLDRRDAGRAHRRLCPLAGRSGCPCRRTHGRPLLQRPRCPGAPALALHQPAQQDADPLRGGPGRRAEGAEGRGRPVLRQPRACHPRAAQPLHHAGLALARRHLRRRCQSAHPGRRRRRCQALRLLRFSGRAPVLRRTHPPGARAPHHRRRGAQRSTVLRVGQEGSQGHLARQRLHPAHAHGGARVRSRGRQGGLRERAPQPPGRLQARLRRRGRRHAARRGGSRGLGRRSFATTRSAGFGPPPARAGSAE